MKQFINRSVAIFGVLLASCSSDHSKHADYHVKFVTPRDHAVLSGLVDVRLDIAIAEPAKTFEVGVDGEKMVNPPIVSNTLRLNTREIKNGNRTLVVKLTGDSGQQWSDSVGVEVKNPDFQLVSYQANAVAYSKGDTVSLDLKYPVAGLTLGADFSELDDEFSDNGVTTKDLGNGNYQLAYALSATDAIPPGHHEVTVSATNASNETVSSRIDLRLREGPRLPITIDNAVFIDDSTVPVLVASSSAPVIQQLSGATQLISGAPQPLTVGWTQSAGQPADRMFVRAANYSGYYVIPVADAPSQQASIPLNLQFAQGNPQSSNVDLYVAIADAAGKIANWSKQSVATQTLPQFGAQVTLIWNNAADLDLKVTSPNGATVGYGSPTIDGGLLELDANAMCTKSPISAERVSWAPGEAIAGQYTVTASIYDTCGTSGADFAGIVSYCGKAEMFAGQFTAADVGADGRNTPVATFNVDCLNRLYGIISYEKIYGYQVLSTQFRAAFVPVRAVTNGAAGRTVLSETTTDEVGNYSLYLPASTGANYTLEVDASFTPPGATTPFARVTAQNSNYSYRYTAPGVDTGTANETEQDVLIYQGEEAGAFNILDRIEQGYQWLTAHLSTAELSRVTPVVARWTLGKDSPAWSASAGKGPYLSYYLGDTVYIGGSYNDISEYDDPVIAHEFFHHVAFHLGLPPIGGAHTFSGRSDPRLALSEAIATAFGQQSLGYSRYWDTYGLWVTSVDLENRAPSDVIVKGADYGTEDGTMKGNISEFLVAAVLWDLMDPGGGTIEPWDRFDSTYTETIGSISQYLPLTNLPDRGVKGADFVDFLDGWRCRRANADADNENLSLLLKERELNYDFAWLICP